MIILGSRRGRTVSGRMRLNHSPEAACSPKPGLSVPFFGKVKLFIFIF